jgi:hypothetical protein
MYIRNALISGLAAASTVQAYSNSTIRDEDWTVPSPAPVQEKRTVAKIFGIFDGIFGGGGGKQPAQECPAVWTQISSTLTQQFLADGQCTDAARAAIRSSFHDCFNGACDGSLILANECANKENRGMERLCGNLANVASQTKVGVADLIQFAAAHAVKTCPGGPTIPVKVGRKDSSEANALGVLPSGHAKAGDLVGLFGKLFLTICIYLIANIYPSTKRLYSLRPRCSYRCPHRRQTTLHRPFQSRRFPGLDCRHLGQQILLRDYAWQSSLHTSIR